MHFRPVFFLFLRFLLSPFCFLLLLMDVCVGQAVLNSGVLVTSLADSTLPARPRHHVKATPLVDRSHLLALSRNTAPIAAGKSQFNPSIIINSSPNTSLIGTQMFPCKRHTLRHDKLRPYVWAFSNIQYRTNGYFAQAKKKLDCFKDL